MASAHSRLPIPTLEEAWAALDYDPLTGILTWKDRPELWPAVNRRLMGQPAGHRWCCNPKRPPAERRYYIIVRFNYRTFFAHRLIWFMQTGEWPKDEIDHRDGDGTHNWWTNLRPATKMQNNANSRLSRRNSTGYKGVSREGRMYRARLYHRGERRELGLFPCPEEAHEVYMREKRRIHGDFARAR